jgi:ABC-type transporter Mla MlaB component
LIYFSYYRSDGGERWKLGGQLSGPWVDELRVVWRRIRQNVRRAHAVVDLKEVTLIDGAGKQLLEEMQREGADLFATEEEQLAGGRI